jgi:hypothetical protein
MTEKMCPASRAAPVFGRHLPVSVASIRCQPAKLWQLLSSTKHILLHAAHVKLQYSLDLLCHLISGAIRP